MKCFRKISLVLLTFLIIISLAFAYAVLDHGNEIPKSAAVQGHKLVNARRGMLNTRAGMARGGIRPEFGRPGSFGLH